MDLKTFTIFIWGYVFFFPLVYSKIVNNGVKQPCSSPWVQFRESCYLFNQKPRVSFYDGEDFCRARGGYLASIHSESENEFFLKMAQSSTLRRQWIGLNILKDNNTFQWTDGTPVNYTKTIPKNFYKNEKCFMFLLEDKKGWRPEHCGLHYTPICKRPADVIPSTLPPPTTLPPDDGHCPDGWIQFGQKCYKYFGKEEKDRLQFKQAREACWSLGKSHDIVSIHSMAEQAFLTEHLNVFGSSVWIGMQKVESDEIGHDIVFGWVDNSRKDFTFWTSGHPPPGTWKYCGRLSYEGVAKGQWIADYCETDKKGYICQRPTDSNLPAPKPEPSKCDSNSVEYRESCYRFFSKSRTHDEAEESCKQIGGHLVSVIDAFEQSFLYNYISFDSKLIWNGLSSVQQTQYLRWTDKEPLYYSNWMNEQPKWNKSKKVCSAFDVSNDLKWDLINCSSRLPYVCEITEGETPPSFPEVIGSCGKDNSSWIDIGDEYCYHVGQSMSWDSSLRYCISKGMQMVKTYSTHQTNSLVAYLWRERNAINLGMIRKTDKKSFVWVDGSDPKGFTNWDTREPSDYAGDRDCVAFSPNTGKWNTIPCSSYGLTICQAKKNIIS